MPVSVTMPQLGESVTEGTVTRWLKKEGDRVEADEPLLEVSTDKVDTEIPSPTSGVLTRIVVAEDETVEVGAELAVIDQNGAAAAAPAEQAAPQQPQEAPQPEPQPEPQPQPVAEQPPAPPSPPPAPPAPQPAYTQAPPPPPPAPQPQPQAPAPQPQAEPTPLPTTGETPYVTPLVRKLAAEHGVDLNTLTGTGVGGRIRKQDVLEAARIKREQAAKAAQAQQAPAAPQQQAPAADQPAPAPAPEPVKVDTTLRGRTEKMSRLRQTIAKRTLESLQTSAQLTTVVEVDVTKIARLRERAKDEFLRREGVKLTFLPFFALATVEALKQHPKLNAVINNETMEVTYHDVEHLGIAVDAEKGLAAVTIRNAGDLNIAGLARKIDDLADRFRNNKVSPDELVGATFTLTNTGSRGALFDTPILFQPQVGILGTGKVVKRPVVVDDPELGEVIAVRSMVYLALTYDHRLIDGADAARFLTTIKNRLEEGRFEHQLGLHS
ncbi:2-oxoglutarate dehydrogenase, E2 component, dihydrolipoamide succinyltransferase [Thermostaphylospora chromogena]|uniref:Dihydrolipoamide acetyltransferase component of pyruvate dehydrogenase complex n=1 Tax=Thermostaphylospora chromogena TaxID=35622 RepID=A0A1H1G3S3_9ACTN|nr:2-oxoglutarate dehydrogenase, E2 component, dihydrolipoamide succinyltransferase [Thermostaphylospora chromogena]SDR07568.1 2-oxoglutarate dehydrogenase E2 component [Thermostaphylospora chromogena]